MLTRENKAGLVVSGSFLVLVAIVVSLKLREPPNGKSAPEEGKTPIAALAVNSQVDASGKTAQSAGPAEKPVPAPAPPEPKELPTAVVNSAAVGQPAIPMLEQKPQSSPSPEAKHINKRGPASGPAQSQRPDRPQTTVQEENRVTKNDPVPELTPPISPLTAIDGKDGKDDSQKDKDGAKRGPQSAPAPVPEPATSPLPTITVNGGSPEPQALPMPNQQSGQPQTQPTQSMPRAAVLGLIRDGVAQLKSQERNGPESGALVEPNSAPVVQVKAEEVKPVAPVPLPAQPGPVTIPIPPPSPLEAPAPLPTAPTTSSVPPVPSPPTPSNPAPVGTLPGQSPGAQKPEQLTQPGAVAETKQDNPPGVVAPLPPPTPQVQPPTTPTPNPSEVAPLPMGTLPGMPPAPTPSSPPPPVVPPAPMEPQVTPVPVVAPAPVTPAPVALPPASVKEQPPTPAPGVPATPTAAATPNPTLAPVAPVAAEEKKPPVTLPSEPKSSFIPQGEQWNKDGNNNPSNLQPQKPTASVPTKIDPNIRPVSVPGDPLPPIESSSELKVPPPPTGGDRPAATPSKKLPTTAPIRIGTTTGVHQAGWQGTHETQDIRVMRYKCGVEDTWESIATKHLQSDDYGRALCEFNLDNPQTSEAVKTSRRPVPNSYIYIPSTAVLHENYKSFLTKTRSK